MFLKIYFILFIIFSNCAISQENNLKLIEISPFNSSNIKDLEIISPKSIMFHPNKKKFYINALESGKTLVYEYPNFKKITTINHNFQEKISFSGKPVEGIFSHNGKYLWITYYRWSYDSYGIGKSGFGLIDTDSDQLIKYFPTGNIPKFISSINDSVLAVTLWGENNVELFDISKIDNVKSLGIVSLGNKVFAVPGSNRDKTCGMCLRGTAFIPNTDIMAVAGMGDGSISLINFKNKKKIRKLIGFPDSPRHLQVYNEYLYFSANNSGSIGKVSLSDLIKSTNDNSFMPKIEFKKIGSGARTLKIVNDKIYVALNNSKEIAITNLDFSNIKKLNAPAFPVGLDIKDDLLIVTSQGKNGVGGHKVWIYDLHN